MHPHCSSVHGDGGVHCHVRNCTEMISSRSLPSFPAVPRHRRPSMAVGSQISRPSSWARGAASSCRWCARSCHVPTPHARLGRRGPGGSCDRSGAGRTAPRRRRPPSSHFPCSTALLTNTDCSCGLWLGTLRPEYSSGHRHSIRVLVHRKNARRTRSYSYCPGGGGTDFVTAKIPLCKTTGVL